MSKKNIQCPGCGKPLNEHINYCYDCNRFVDANTGQFIPDDQVTDRDLEQLASVSKETGKQWKKTAAHGRMVVGIILILVACVLFFIWVGEMAMGKMILILTVLVAVGIALVVSAGNPPQAFLTMKTWKQILSRTLIPSVLNEVFDSVSSYEADAAIDENKIRQTDILQQKWDRFSGSDTVHAVYQGYPVEMGNIILEKEDQNVDSDEAKFDLVFKGNWILVDLKKEFSEDLEIIENFKGEVYDTKTTVKMDNEAFNQRFQVRCKDRHEVFYYLTPVKMEKINHLCDNAHGRTCIKVMKDGKAAIAVNGDGNIFLKPSKYDNTVTDTRNRFRNEMEHRMSLVKELTEILCDDNA